MQNCIFHPKYGNLLIRVHALDRFVQRGWKAGVSFKEDILSQFKEEFDKSRRITEHVYDEHLKRRGKEKQLFFENDLFRFVVSSNFIVTTELCGKYEHLNKDNNEHLCIARRPNPRGPRPMRETRHKNVSGICTAFADLLSARSIGQS